ncbi:hypothetical protein RISK_004177 [Rhodopirellula islandica]|uniref:Uncharacterized protein n=1 Tax=Rhodopirellula islandica TaxID=595434 RepID=A0A0J1BAN8_RHOIS|nr:hypothetical protein RISK_004177 [Rhodopirellula islandica]
MLSVTSVAQSQNQAPEQCTCPGKEIVQLIDAAVRGIPHDAPLPKRSLGERTQ